MMKTPRLETERLLLREVQENDVNSIFECWMQDEDVSRYMWWKASSEIEEAKGFVEYELGQIDNKLWKRWIIVLKESKEIIGTCLVFFDDETNHWDISYNLGKKFWKKGYVTEAMKTAMDYAVNELGMEECITTYAKENPASGRVLAKLGFVNEKEVPYECNGGEIKTVGILCRFKAN